MTIDRLQSEVSKLKAQNLDARMSNLEKTVDKLFSSWK